MKHDGIVKNCAVYAILAYTMTGKKELLGI
jgi:hypothetical protein